MNAPRIQAGQGLGSPDVDSAESGSSDLQWVLRVLRRRWKLIVSTVCVVTGITAIYVFSLPATYSSSALVIVDPQQQNILDPQGVANALPGDIGRVDSEVEVLSSPSVMLAVVGNLKLTDDQEFRPGPGRLSWINSVLGLSTTPLSGAAILDATLRRLTEAVSISRVGLTYLIEVRATSLSPDKAALIANAVANAYISGQIEGKIQVATGIQQALAKRADEAAAAMRSAEAAIDDFVEQNADRIGDDATRQALQALRQQIGDAETQRAQLAAVVAASAAALSGSDWQKLADQLGSDTLRSLSAQRQSLAASIDSNTPAGGQSVTDLRASLADIDQRLAREGQSELAAKQAAVDAANNQEEALRSQLRDRVAGVTLTGNLLVDFYQKQQDATAAQSTYQDLLNRSKAIDAQKDIQVADSRIVSQALPSLVPSGPKRNLALLAAGAASLTLGLALAFFREIYRAGFGDAGQVEDILRLPVIASLPHLSRRRAKGYPGKLATEEVVAYPHSVFSEGVRRIFHRLESVPAATVRAGRSCRIVLVSSALPGEGKTQVAVSLARSIAMSDRNVLLVDCDVRRPAVTTALGVEGGTGLADYLSEALPEEEISGIVHSDKLTNLKFLSGSLGVRRGADTLFQTPRFAKLMAMSADFFDYIILDSSPALLVVDPWILARQADAMLMVVEANQTAQRDVSAAVREFQRFGQSSKPIFVVLNGAEPTFRAYSAPYFTNAPLAK